MSRNYENGIISTTAGGSTDLSGDFETTGVVYWVDSVNGNDSNAGTNRNEPKATLSSALTAATTANGDIIILEAGHAETLSASLSITKGGIRIMGLGTGSNKPSFTVDAAIDGISITTGGYIDLNNLRFPEGTTTANTSRINVDADGVRITDCDFLCGANDAETITLTGNATNCTITGGSITVTADGPDSGIEIESATAYGLVIDGMTFDGGDHNFDNGAIYSTVAHLEYLYRNLVLTNKANVIHTAAAKGQAYQYVLGDGSYLQL